MPELPEVETIAAALSRAVVGEKIVKVEVFSPAMRTPLTPLLYAHLEGRQITSVRRRARYLIIGLDDERCILMHFGMSGVIRLEGAEVPKRKHEHIFLYLSGGMILRFECPRRFSICEVHSDLATTGVPRELESRLGVEPLTPDFSGEYLFSVSRNRKNPVKNFIMDNAIVVGVGNIYATESLFAAGISPLRPAGELTRPEAEKLTTEIKTILKRAIAAGGSTIRDYRHVDGSEGKFAQTLLMYGHAGESCPRCGSIIECVKLGGRSSCYCPECQK